MYFTLSTISTHPSSHVKVLAGQGDKIDVQLLVQKAIEEEEEDSTIAFTDMPFLRIYGIKKGDGKARVFTVPKVVLMLLRLLAPALSAFSVVFSHVFYDIPCFM